MIRFPVREHGHGLTAGIALRPEHKVRLRGNPDALIPGQRHLQFQAPQVFPNGQGISFLPADHCLVHFDALAIHFGHGQRLQELRLKQAVQQCIHGDLTDIWDLLQRLAPAQNLLEHVRRNPPGNLVDSVGLTVSIHAVIAAIFIGI